MNSFAASRDWLDVEVIGADLDMTLVDTRDATAVALQALNDCRGYRIDVEAFVSRLGPPLRSELSRWVPDENMEEAVRLFRTAFLEQGLAELTPLPGVMDFVRVIESRGSKLVVITSRVQRVAEACLQAVDIPCSVVAGGLTGHEKASAIAQHDVQVYIGDHQLDVVGAHTAGVPVIGVTTGSHSRSELIDAGAEMVVGSFVELCDTLQRAD